jgi:hypothetical protein
LGDGFFGFEGGNNKNVKYIFHHNDYELIIYFEATPFYFEKIELVKPDEIKLDAYTGKYYSEELSLTYTISKKENKLFLSYPNNPDIPLFSCQKDEFTNGYRTKYSFHRDHAGNIERLTVASEGVVKDIEFRK